MALSITIWNEGLHEKTSPAVAAHYPDGIHAVLAEALGSLEDVRIRTATLEDPDCGLPPEVLDDTDVLLWWGHMAHGRVPDETAARVADAVLRGMGFLVLHSGHMAKPFVRLMGTSCTLTWRDDDRERLWTILPAHPIAQGIPEQFEIPMEEMYGEPFDIPEPDETVFLGWFAGGEVFRSGCVFRRGRGRVFYFQPGHETYPIYHHPHVRQILRNAVRYLAPTAPRRKEPLACPNAPAPEKRD